MEKTLFALLLAAAAGCSTAPAGAPLAPEDELGERAAPGEEALIREIAELTVAALKREHGGSKGVMTRDVHAKAHGCVRATFTVGMDLPAEYRAGVLAEPGRSYPAWIRFSNGSPKIRSDKRGDARGMAIKLMGVPGEKLLEGAKDAGTQDFVLITHDAFFVKDAADYAELSRLLAKGSSPARFFLGRLPWRWKELRAAVRLIERGRAVRNPLFAPYFSATPYTLGERSVVKYAAEPCAPDPDPRGLFGGSPDRLRLSMARTLDPRGGTGACFRFLVQRRSDPAEMSVEDSRVPWDRAKSEFLPVATLSIPPQEFSGERQARFCEDLSFTPWHALPAHRPLGGVNRTRKAVYEAVSAFRREANGSPRREPEPGDAP